MEPLFNRYVEETKNPVGVPEYLVNWDKHVIIWGFASVDDSACISKNLASAVVSKCVRFQANFFKDGSTLIKTGHGHGGFIRGERTWHSTHLGYPTTSCSVYPITAKHNLRCENDTSTPERCYKPVSANLLLHSYDAVAPLWGSDELGWQPTEADYFDLREGDQPRPVISLYGFDISVGSVIEEDGHPACGVSPSFERVDKDFKLEKGQKVGMAVLFTEETKPTLAKIVGASKAAAIRAGTCFGESQIIDLYGEAHRVTIYTGEITYVGRKHIEYDMNSFTGCSGAIVFLLDKEQPVSVNESDWGKAVAVHAGGCPSSRESQNYGFLINEHPVFKDLSSEPLFD